MTNNLLLHPTTQSQIDSFLTRPSHALLLIAPAGAGKWSVAHLLCLKLLGAKTVESHPYVKLVTPSERGTISIDIVRQVRKFLQLKTTGQAKVRRVVIIEQAGNMTTEAQNALLKILEEPPSDTVLLLTAETRRGLLPTILSRIQSLSLKAPNPEELKQFFAKKGRREAEITQAFFLSGGLPGLMSALLVGGEPHPMAASVAIAKSLLQKNTFERLCLVDGLTKQKADLDSTLEALIRIAQSGIAQAANKGEVVRLKQWHRIRVQAYEAQKALLLNANAKLVLTKMLLHI